ncbi:small RNA 2'-O-methyltransferase isoform X1 [Tachysurus fulvidraco]|uniref:small RNA 2'-O-methyltransferase isoform X1 n=2 Tax=Tachysurus fulvidraco TaxID=1234273 RepID=UPI000F4FDD61|nr:small RNA 2'-O-methyltransferase isoform X1 [Tachysurus fulvidraco]
MNGFFSPPLHLQRHQFVIEFVKKSRPRTVLDLGCSGCSLLRKLRFHRHSVELLAGVDIDCAAIRQNMKALDPLMAEYLQPSSRPLTIKLYEGSITETEPCTKGFDLITCIEVMEHLQLWEVERFSEVLFEYMEPHTVIISMPNAEFNPLLPGLTGFRHKDHKYEWTRAQFQAWAEGVCRKYGYSVEFTGVGEAPGETRNVGFCSQIAIFQREFGDLHRQRNNPEQEPTVYKLLYRMVYPSLSDNNILQKTLVSEVLYKAEQLKKEWLEGQEGELCDFTFCEQMLPSEAVRQAMEVEEVYMQGSWVCVPLLCVWASSTVQALCSSFQELRAILLVDLQVQLDADRDVIMLPVAYEEEDEEDVEQLDEGEKVECMSRSVNDNVEEDWESEL